MTILNSEMAQRFINKLGKYLEYNINVMNENGLIIASRDESRIGDFHQIAYEKLHGTPDVSEVAEETKYIGTKPGVNLFIEYKNKPIGVVGVTGNPENVKSFAGLVKLSLEAMLEHEVYMEKKRSDRSKIEQFLYALLFEDNPDYALLEKTAEDISIRKDGVYVVIIIHLHKQMDKNLMVRSIRNADGWSYYDFVTLASNDNIVALKSLEPIKSMEQKDYKYDLRIFLDDLILKSKNILLMNDLGIYVGSVQNRIKMYRKSYLHAHNVFMQSKHFTGIKFFEDEIKSYLRSLVTIKEYHDVFNIYSNLFTEEEQEMIGETVDALEKNNYNVVNSAKMLFLHRNTLVFRLNKIKSTLNIDPINDSSSRQFLNELAYYFRNK